MITFEEAADVFCVRTDAPQGYTLVQHAHEHDHLSILAQGTARVTTDGVSRDYAGPAVLTIKAHSAHEVYAVTPIVWFCLWGSEHGMQNAAPPLKLEA